MRPIVPLGTIVLVSMVLILGLVGISSGGNVNDRHPKDDAVGGAVGDQVEVEATGDFVDVYDLEAIEAWSRNMCAGLDLKHAAQTLGTEASIRAVAAAISKGLPTATSGIAQKVCEEELRKEGG